MTSRSKIVGITRLKPDPEGNDSTGDVPVMTLTNADHSEILFETEVEQPTIFPEEPLWEYDTSESEHALSGQWKDLILPVFLGFLLLAWTGFFGWVHWQEASLGLNNERIVSLIGLWSLPACLIGVAWLLVLRSSRSETARFGDAARLLRNESEALQVRMRTVNEEISTARAFLAENARELESIGRLSAKRLTEAADELGRALVDSDMKAKTLEEASNAATTNLEQLRKHLPVVTSAAKDVTNQIGSAGNSAQVQVKSLIAGLQRVAEASDLAHNRINEMSETAAVAASGIASCVDQSAETLANTLLVASERSAAMTERLDSASMKTATVIKTISAEVEGLLLQSGDRLTAQVTELNNAVAALTTQSEKEDVRINSIIGRLAKHIDESESRVREIDESATERTVKLAFSVETIAAASTQLSDSMAENHKNAEVLIGDAEKLLLALDTANREVEDSLPSSLARVEERLSTSLAQIDMLALKATQLGDHSDHMLTKLSGLQNVIDAQHSGVDELMAASDEHFTARHEQAQELSATLIQTRGLLEEMASSADDNLISSLGRVHEATKQAAEATNKILNDELSTIAERLGAQNNATLAGAVDAQVAALNDIIQNSVARSMSLSEASTQKISAQLAQIDEMTGNLERRLEDARGSFVGIDDDSFARQMVLLTESLNSTAIDVAKILSNEVTDTSWAAYLKGDRGVFTRRAVRLLDAGEAKAIAHHYGDDVEFREHVNRYIHDFESMMRVMLSTRDGNAIGVTLLSSDVGKLYVALAQAIERLRS